MTDKPKNPPAFPLSKSYSGRYTGMDLRDYFAGQVIAGVDVRRAVGSSEDVAASAYRLADAMLKERSK